jgi:carbamate kinase
VVGSPRPRRIIELELIESLVAQGHIVIACGGGGIPVVEGPDGSLEGLEAVIDKDFASAKLAHDLGADLFVVSTGVEKVAIHFNQPQQRWIDRMTVTEARRYLDEGHFPKGSMGPKIEAIAMFLAAGGPRRAIITDPPNLGRALAGETGTHVIPD